VRNRTRRSGCWRGRRPRTRVGARKVDLLPLPGRGVGAGVAASRGGHVVPVAAVRDLPVPRRGRRQQPRPRPSAASGRPSPPLSPRCRPPSPAPRSRRARRPSPPDSSALLSAAADAPRLRHLHTVSLFSSSAASLSKLAADARLLATPATTASASSGGWRWRSASAIWARCPRPCSSSPARRRPSTTDGTSTASAATVSLTSAPLLPASHPSPRRRPPSSPPTRATARPSCSPRVAMETVSPPRPRRSGAPPATSVPPTGVVRRKVTTTQRPTNPGVQSHQR
jgi:hypothetical protein